MKWLCFGLICFLVTSCFSRTAMMTRQNFDAITIGTPISELQEKVGKPYAIYSKGQGVQEYEYLERIDMDHDLVAENHYFLVIANGKVVGKRMNRERPPAYDLIYEDDPNNISP